MKEDTVLRELQLCQLDILRELDRICRDNKLTYCLAFGSCLGAVRHGGFIPWDDDIDVYMPIADFERLKKLADTVPAPFFLQTHETDPEYGLMIGRMRNSDTTLIEKNEADRQINHGVFIDIYPLFNCPKRGLKKKVLIFLSMLYRLFLYERVPVNRGKVYKFGAGILLRVVPEALKKRWLKLCCKHLCGQKVTGYISSLYGDEVSTVYPVELMWPPKEVSFESVRTFIPNDADRYLTATYGDYMQLPPTEKQTFHHNYELIDLNSGYEAYRGTVWGRNKP